jgi:hypothetical protein
MEISVIPRNADDILCSKTLSRSYISIHIEIHNEIINNEILIYFTEESL